MRGFVIAAAVAALPATAAASEDDDLRIGAQVSLAPGAIGRVGGDVLIRAYDRHAVIVSGHATAARTFVDVATSRGGELGWRWYGSGPLYGVFVGAVARVVSTTREGETIARFGPALDIGWQSVEIDRWTLSAGLGVQWMFGPPVAGDGLAQLIDGPGLRPRMLLNVGRFF